MTEVDINGRQSGTIWLRKVRPRTSDGLAVIPAFLVTDQCISVLQANYAYHSHATRNNATGQTRTICAVGI